MTSEMKQGKRIDWILIVIVLLSGFLNFFNVWNQTSDNAYYTSAVTSMLQSFHNFFFASFDPGGYVTVDKPPVVFWIQTAFAYVFGLHGWSVVLPQALAGVGSVLLIYFLVKPTFGKTAARFAGLIMACSPIAVAISRTNNIDSMLVFTLLLAAWMLFKGIREKKVSWVIGAFALISVGFNMKMLQAYMVVPAFYVFYLIGFKSRWKKKLTVLLSATVLMVAVSLSWAVVVDSIPAKDRPYVGSSKTNSVLELAFGYNGISRLLGNQQDPKKLKQSPQGNIQNGNGKQGKEPSLVRVGGNFGIGDPGVFRLFQKELSGQISWLLPFVLFASVGLLSGIRRRQPLTDKQKETLFWLAWLIPGMVFFSVAGFFHHYYLIMLAPPIAAIAGSGWVELWNQYIKQEGWKMWLLPSAILVTTGFELYVLFPFHQQIGIGWSYLIGILGIASSLVLFFARKKQGWTPYVALAGMLILLIAPLYWSSTGVTSGVNGSLPQAGPDSNLDLNKGKPIGVPNRKNNGEQGSNQDLVNNSPTLSNNGGQESGQNTGMSGPSNSMQGSGANSSNSGMKNTVNAAEVNPKLLAYLTKHNNGEKYLFATPDTRLASPYIIQTGKAVMAMGGFSGSDPILTVAKLQEMIKNKEVKFFLIPSQQVGNEVLNWIKAHSKVVPNREWASSQSGDPMQNTLYEIKD